MHEKYIHSPGEFGAHGSQHAVQQLPSDDHHVISSGDQQRTSIVSKVSSTNTSGVGSDEIGGERGGRMSGE